MQATYLNRLPNPKRMLYATQPAEPSPSCAVCGHAQIRLAINTHTATLSMFVSQVASDTAEALLTTKCAKHPWLVF